MTNANKIGRNSQCHCGSGKKFKNCCIEKVQKEASRAPIGASLAIVVLGLAGAAALLTTKGVGSALAAVAGAIIVAVAVYIFRDPNPPRGGKSGDSSAINFGR
tara:strand:- start:139555 stop:139863 length:309 start_codon:yes stop_codon:yes gene_type:complete